MLSLLLAAALACANPAPDQAADIPCGWIEGWRTQDSRFAALDDGVELSNSGAGVAYLQWPMQIDADAGLQLLTYSGVLETEDASGRGAMLDVTLFDADGNRLTTRDMPGVELTGDERRTISMSVALPAGVEKALGGVILYGGGTARFSQVSMTVEPVASREPSDLARAYVDEAVAYIAKNALYRDKVDLEQLRRDAYGIAGPARTPEEVHGAVEYLLASLGDSHSFFMPKAELDRWSGAAGPETVPDVTMPRGRMVGNYGLIWMPGMHSDVPDQKYEYSTTLHALLHHFETEGVDGWIVDMRDNDGGNMMPMLDGIHPLLDVQKLGALVDVNGNAEEWWADPSFGPVDGPENYRSLDFRAEVERGKPIAVLYGPKAGSSGEVLIISFIGNTNTRSFGQPSFGISTGNGAFELSDGSQMRIASTVMADRSGRKYGGKVTPDVLVEPVEGKDAALEAAVAWLESRTSD